MTISSGSFPPNVWIVRYASFSPACFQIQHEIILIVDINHAALHGLNQAVHIVLQIFQGLSHLLLALGVNQIRGSLLEQKRLQQQRRQGASRHSARIFMCIF